MKVISSVSYDSRSITEAVLSETERTWARCFSIRGTSNRSLPGRATIFFFPVRISIASIRHLLAPCFPVLLTSFERTVQACPSMRIVVPGLQS